MKIAFVTSETLPFSKTGGLADVVYGLAKSYVESNHEVTVISPLYGDIDSTKFKRLCSLPVQMNWRQLVAEIYEVYVKGVRYVFVSNSYYFKREKLYGYDDDIERFAFFNLAFLEIVRRMNFRPDILHLNDWETAMIPLLLKDKKIKIPTVLTIHNPAFQGNYHPGALGDYFNLSYDYFENGTCRFHDYFSCLKTGIMTVDKLTTVSKTHAKELLEDTEHYNNLGYIIRLRKKDFCGIVNGVDEEEFNPANDQYIKYKFDSKSFETEKRANKKALFEMSDMAGDGPVFGIISRLTEQKGLDILPLILPKLLSANAKLFVIGNGQLNYENMMQDLQKKYSNNVFYFCGYSNNFAHRVYASSDFILMPSRYEPCGISQLISKRYGTLPIVSSVGGLVDTVIPLTDTNKVGKSDGFRFELNNIDDIEKTIDLALRVYNDKKVMNTMIKNAMKYPSGWNDISDKYIKLYLKLVK